MSFTPEEESVLRSLITRESDKAKLQKDVEAAAATLADAEARFMAEHEQAQIDANNAMNAVNVKYAVELAAARAAVRDAEVAITAVEAEAATDIGAVKLPIEQPIKDVRL